jgi:uncharacterized protein
MKSLRVFIDTGAWFATQVTDDEHHAVAADSLRALLSRPRILVTTNHVIGETYTLLHVACGHVEAVRFVDLIQETTRLERVFVTARLEAQAFELLRRFSDQDFSFVDATSFAVMRAQRIRYAFAFDKHFSTAGFLRIPNDVPIDQL